MFCLKMNVNISNELNFSDVYRSVNYNGSLAKFTRNPLGFIHFARDPIYRSVNYTGSLAKFTGFIHFARDPM